MLDKVPEAERLCDCASRLDQAGRYGEALSQFDAVLARYPGYPRAWHARGVLLFKNGDAEEGIAALKECLQSLPGYAAAHHSLGKIYRSTGRAEQALECFEKSLAIDSAFAPAHHGIGELLQENDETLDRAAGHFTRSIACQPDFLPAHVGLIKVCLRRSNYRRALSVCQKARRIFRDHPAIMFHLGLIRAEYGDLEGAIACFSAVGDDAAYGELALGSLQFFVNLLPDANQELIYRTAKRYEEQVAGKRYHLQHPHVHHPDPERRLRVGFVSGDFKYHPVSRHLAPLVSCMDASRFELYAYNRFKTEDGMTQRFKARFDRWRDIHDTAIDECVRMIRNDRIDILIDLSGFTAYTGLVNFAERPAPVQMSWLGYFNTTGLTAMDYLITDATTVHPGEERFFSEKVLRLPETRFCYEPLDDLPSIAPLPARSRGYVTFGAFTRPAKLNDDVLGAWAQILLRSPGARLVLKWGTFTDRSIRASICRRLMALGVDRSRIEFRYSSGYRDLLAEYTRDIDIVLDTFPHSGGGTSSDALFMGVPVVTFSGCTPLSRQTHGFLRLIGLEDELVGFSAKEYVKKAVRLATDVDRIESLRESLRERLLASPLCDAATFTRHFENLLLAAWREWCSGQSKWTRRPKQNADAEELFHEGDRLADLGCYSDAVRYLEQGKRVAPYNDKLLNLLGICYWERSQLDKAAATLRQALRINPANADAYCNLGGVLLQMNRARQALRVLEAGVALDGQHANLMINRAIALRRLFRLPRALETIQACLDTHEPSARMHAVRGGIFFRMGRVREAISDCAAAVELSGGDIRPRSEYICMLNYDEGYGQRELYERTLACMARIPCREGRPQANGGGRLVIGLVSADLHNHPVGLLSLAFLMHFDREKFEVVCYYNGTVPDQVSVVLAGYSTLWRPVLGLTDSQFCRQIQEDRVDVLVDMSGHTDGNRLGVFAMRPCRLQVAWPGYFNTSGLAVIDAFISDRFTTPEWMQSCFSERIAYLPYSRFCYTPQSLLPHVTPAPSETNGYVTFGSFNNISKYSDSTLLSWANILRAVPGSRLLLKSASLEDREVRRMIRSRLKSAGIDAKRVELRGYSARNLMLAEYADMDIALDPFPFGGGMTSLDTLWMGVPVITRAGDTPASRQTGSFLTLIGMDELIAGTFEEYEQKAVELAGDPSRLAELRSNLRECLQKSPLLDGERFAGDLGGMLVRLHEELPRE